LSRHGILASNINRNAPPAEVIVKMGRMAEEGISRAAERKRLYGETQLPNSAEFNGMRMVGVGSAIYGVDPKLAPLNFMGQLLIQTLSRDWFTGQLAAAENSATPIHPIISWCRDTMAWQDKHVDKDGMVSGVLSGPARAWFLLGYDVWVLMHHFLLQPLLPRLRDIKQFQGARYELTTYALFIPGGFKPERDAETDNASKHVEFVAHNAATGERVAVEAKSRHRPGVLGFPSAGYKSEDDPNPGITGRLRDALEQRRAMPYVICLELNLPPAATRREAEAKLKLAQAEIETVTQEYSQNNEPFPATLVVVTNYSHHYGEPDKPDPRWYQSVIQVRNPAHTFTHPDTTTQIIKALDAYGNMPKSWDVFDR